MSLAIKQQNVFCIENRVDAVSRQGSAKGSTQRFGNTCLDLGVTNSFPGVPGAGEVHLWLCRQPFVPEAGLMRTLVSRYLGVPPKALDFIRGPNGKPSLAPTALQSKNQTHIEFNLSHSGPWQVLALSGAGAVGVDIEYRDPSRDISNLARCFYTASEARAMDKFQQEVKLVYFYNCWVLKEALAKAAGESIATTLGKVGFMPTITHNKLAGDNWITGRSDAPDLRIMSTDIKYWVGEAPADDRQRHYSLFELSLDWSLSVCVECESPPAIEIFTSFATKTKG